MATATATRTHLCGCLDLPRNHARGDAGCTYDTHIAPTLPNAATIARRQSHAAQAQAFLRDLATDLHETR